MSVEIQKYTHVRTDTCRGGKEEEHSAATGKNSRLQREASSSKTTKQKKREMKIVTYNVNGLKARIVPYKTLYAFLSALDADIICLQETKLSRQELNVETAFAEGYEGFFSCTRTFIKGKIGYSGVATFCRMPLTTCKLCTSGVLPIAADEGFTGLLHRSKGGEIEGLDRIGFYDDVLNMGLPQDELLKLDWEGRCVITDHGSFVLFNIYGPCVQSEDTARMEFKLNFYQALQCRWESLLSAGRRLIIVGDLNISPFPIDSCDPGPHFNSNPCRRWLQSLLSTEGGPFTDVFRAVHGKKENAYTCWSQASGAEEFNYGTRIDLILAAGSCMSLCRDGGKSEICTDCKGFAECSVQDCDIMVKFKRFKEDSVPRWAGGRTIKLEGSDHAPVYVSLKEQPPVKAHEVPSLAVRYLPQLHGRQQSIYTLLQKKNQSINGANLELSSVRSEEGSLDAKDVEVAPQVDEGSSFDNRLEKNDKGTAALKDETTSSPAPWFEKLLPTLKVQASQKFKRKEVQKASQTSLKAFFSRSSHQSELSAKQSITDRGFISTSQESQMQEGLSDEIKQTLMSCQFDSDKIFMASIEHEGHTIVSNCIDDKFCRNLGPGELEKADVKQENVQAQWKRIQDFMANRIPMCRHGEPCVARIVKKSGPNHGRGFYVCARAAGPASNPEARCDHFEWASDKFKR